MNYFLWVIIIITALSCIGKVKWIAEDEFPERTRKMEVWDVFCQLVLVFWAIDLLNT